MGVRRIWETVELRCVLCLYEANCDPASQERDAFSRLFAALWPTHAWKWLANTIVLGEKEKGVCVCGWQCSHDEMCVIVCCIAFVRVDGRKVRSGSLCMVMDSWGHARTLYLCHYYRCYQTYSTHTQNEQMRQPPAFKWLIASRISSLLWWVMITPVYNLVQGKFSQVQALMLTDLWNYAMLCSKCNVGKIFYYWPLCLLIISKTLGCQITRKTKNTPKWGNFRYLVIITHFKNLIVKFSSNIPKYH